MVECMRRQSHRIGRCGSQMGCAGSNKLETQNSAWILPQENLIIHRGQKVALEVEEIDPRLTHGDVDLVHGIGHGDRTRLRVIVDGEVPDGDW